jgi:hypothetical protein
MDYRAAEAHVKWALPQEAVVDEVRCKLECSEIQMPTQVLIPLSEPVHIARQSAPSFLLIEFFLVQGVGFRCTAYCDPVGKWRDAFTNAELPGEVQILE